MKLLFVTGSLVHGGAERHTITLANRLAERGHECHLAYVKDDPSQLERLRARERAVPARRGVPRLRGPRELENLLTQAEADPCRRGESLRDAVRVARAASAAARVPLAVTFHTTVLHDAKERLKMLYYRPLFWSADWLVFVCEAQRRTGSAAHAVRRGAPR